MKWTELLCCLFSFSVIFSGQLEIYKDNLNILIDDNAYIFATEKFKVKVPSYNVDKKIRQLSDDKLLALLNSNTHYIDLVKCSDDEYVAHLQGRLHGGNVLLGKILYWTTKVGCYVAITAGVVATVVHNTRAQRDADAINAINDQVAQRVPQVGSFAPVVPLPQLMPGGTPAVISDAGLGAVIAESGFAISGAVAGPASAIGAALIANNPTTDQAAQVFAWEFIKANAVSGLGRHVVKNNIVLSDVLKVSVPKLAPHLAQNIPVHVARASAEVAVQAARSGAQAAGGSLAVSGSIAAAGARGGFRRFVGASWKELCKKSGEVGAAIEVIARAAEALGNMVPGPI